MASCSKIYTLSKACSVYVLIKMHFVTFQAATPQAQKKKAAPPPKNVEEESSEEESSEEEEVQLINTIY